VSDLDQLVRDHGPLVYGTAWRILGHAADAEDVVQEVFLEAYRLRTSRVRSWPGFLRRLATCRALDRLRQRKPMAPLDGLSTVEPAAGPEADAMGRELAEQLRAAVARLPRWEGEVFSLRYLDDLTPQQIADTLQISPGAVAVALHKARARLEMLLGTTVRGD
jgi:RNA polymerase sigma-70 factor, ECF subfamily